MSAQFQNVFPKAGSCDWNRGRGFRLYRAGSLAGAVARTSEESDAGDSCDSAVTGSADETYQQSFKMSANIQALTPNGI
jgi:hypothetical protein